MNVARYSLSCVCNPACKIFKTSHFLQKVKYWEVGTVNSFSISGMLTPSHLLGQKVKAGRLPMEENFVRQFQSSSQLCTSGPVLSTTLIFNFCLVRLRKHSWPWKKCSDEILLDQFYIFDNLIGYIIAVCAKLSEDCKLMVKRGSAHGSFLK